MKPHIEAQQLNAFVRHERYNTQAGVPDVNVSLWSGIFGPAHLPPDIARKLEAEIMKIMQMEDVKDKFKKMATPTVGSSSADFAKIIDEVNKVSLADLKAPNAPAARGAAGPTD